MTMQQIFQRFSPLNFAFSEWREAAKRFLELEQELESAERHADQDHEHQDFEVCDDCTRVHELRTQFQRFAEHFGLVWARVDTTPATVDALTSLVTPSGMRSSTKPHGQWNR